MTSREEFLKVFDNNSKKYSSNVCFYFVSESENTLGVSFCEVNRLTKDLSLFFSRIFEGNRQYVGVSLSDSFLLPSIILSIWKSGNIFAGISNQYSSTSTLKFLNFLNVKYLICDKNDEKEKEVCRFCIENETFIILERQIQEKKKKLAEDFCYGIMTSGTTGNIKIIQVPWSCILLNVKELTEELGLNESDCIFQASPYTFDPFFIELFLVLLHGASMVIVSSQIKLNPSQLLKTLFLSQNQILNKTVHKSSQLINKDNFLLYVEVVERKNITILQMTPSVFKRWTSEDIKIILSPSTSLRILILGGEKFPNDVIKLKSVNNKTRIYNIYGITEISCWGFINKITHSSPHGVLSLGKPLNCISYKISESNELFLGSSSRKCLIDDETCLQSQEIIYRNTGDIIEVIDNELYYVGRSNQIFKKYGMKLNLNKIEEVFLKRNGTLSECYCVYDEENLRVGLFFVPADKSLFKENYSHVTLEEFLKFGYKYPSENLNNIEKPEVLISVLQPPVNPHGKCDRKELLKYFKTSLQTSKSVCNLREAFLKIWSEALRIGKDDLTSRSFISLGGSSVSAIEILNKLEDLGVLVPQNFITTLLKEGNFEECLKLLSTDEAPVKRLKLAHEESNVLAVKWKFDLQKCVDATPAIAMFQGKERVIIGSHSSKLSCLDSVNGDEIWSIYLGDRIDSGFGMAENGTQGYIGCYDHYVYCISIVDGSCLWKYKTLDMVKSTPCVSSDGNHVYVASYDRHLYCLSTNDGSLVNKSKLSDGGIYCNGVVSDVLNSFYIGTLDGTCVALNQKSNEIVWTRKLKSPIFASPCLLSSDSEVVFVEVLGVVHCIDSLTGTQVWKYQANGNIYSSPICRNSENTTLIFFGCHDGHLYCLQNKELKWKQQLESPVFARPSLIGSEDTADDWRVCVATTKGFVYVCRFASGQVHFTVKLNGEIFSSPVCTPRNIYVGCRDNYVYSLALQ